ncbi:ABC transporter [Phlyctema vagabunda]|uniref:ABC transporter n=1 Tax=Phlyctema vagabunda TaxID=108571 RepID=A0ABR4PX18_9HELO
MRPPNFHRYKKILHLRLQRPYSQAVIQIKDGTFYRNHPNSVLATNQLSNPPLFKGLDFNLPSSATKERSHYVAIIGPSSSGKTTFLHILRGQHVCIPPATRTWPSLEAEVDGTSKRGLSAIKYVGFDGEQGLGSQAPKSAYLSARYESRREETDFNVLDYLQGNTELNPFRTDDEPVIDSQALEQVIEDLRLGELANMPVSNLSNGQTRRARIAKALLGRPEALLLDEPFMGLDPPTLLTLSPLLHRIAEAKGPRIVLTLRPQDPIPDWIDYIYYLKGNCEVALSGAKDDVLRGLRRYVEGVRTGEVEPDIHMPVHTVNEVGRQLTPHGIIERNLSTRKLGAQPTPKEISPVSKQSDTPGIGEPLVEMEGARVRYGSKTVLGNWQQNVNGGTKDGLWWTVRRGERWGIFGPNGSGKTTILSLISSDHPQTYSLPIKLFGRSRLPEPGQLGISIFDIQARIGQSSPEIHNHMPSSLTVRQVLENAWSETFRGVPKLNDQANARVEACLRWFEEDLNPSAEVRAKQNEDVKPEPSKLAWAQDALFGGLPFSGQRVALFLRAIIKQPDLIILDEAFSGMDDGVRDRCLLFLAHGETKEYSNSESHGDGRTLQRDVVESTVSKANNVKIQGLSKDQALLCISHVREEIPGCVREWICLPEANEGKPARFGRLDGPIEGNPTGWNEIWGLSKSLP